MAPSIPPIYRSLLLLHPVRWRGRDGEVVLSTLMDVHARTGRTAPTVSERLWFLVDGLRMRLRPLNRRSSISTARPRLGPYLLQSFDQTGGAVPESASDAATLVRANAHALQGADLRAIGVPAWIGLGRSTPR